MLMQGRAEKRTDKPEARVASLVSFFFGQRKVMESVTIPATRLSWLSNLVGSRHHFIIFWGFIVVAFGTIEAFAQGLFPQFSWAWLLGTTVGSAINAAVDTMNLLVLVVVLFAVFRRTVLKPRLIPMSRDAAAILGAIAVLMITHFAMHGFRTVAGDSEPGFFISDALAEQFIGMSTATAALIAEANWWVHVVLLLVFLNYLAYSKHSHILASLPNIYFRRLDQRGVLPKLNLEADDMAQTGVVSEWKDLTWKSLLDGFACTECARCSNSCPANKTGKPLSPMQLMHDVRDDLKTRLPDRGAMDDLIEKFQHGEAAAKEARTPSELIGGRVSEEVLWSCTTCGACQEVCPVFIEHPTVIMEMRRNLVLMQEKVPGDLVRTFKNMEQNGNPWGLGADRRMDWAEGHNIPTFDEKPDAEWLLWVGCAGAFDDRLKKQTLALVDILRTAGISFAVLGMEEGCCGDTARRAGNEMLYQMQAQQNIETMNGKKVKKIVTACPHCLHTLKNDYPQMGGQYEVRHHSQLIAELLAQGKIALDAKAADLGKVTFHDPCYLGRWNNEYDAPRTVLNKLGSKPIELERTREHGFCCGAGGGRMWMEEKTGTRVNHDRTDEILATGATMVATACPYCTVMIKDAVDDRNAGERVQVKNISELVAKAMVKKDNASA
jgi:Fe-S oxidoreductase